MKDDQRCMITEQGDLGLGLTPVNENEEKEMSNNKQDQDRDNSDRCTRKYSNSCEASYLDN